MARLLLVFLLFSSCTEPDRVVTARTGPDPGIETDSGTPDDGAAPRADGGAGGASAPAIDDSSSRDAEPLASAGTMDAGEDGMDDARPTGTDAAAAPVGATNGASPELQRLDCGGEVLAFAYTSSEDCTTSGFRCPPGHGAFLNECGCGCREMGLFPESGFGLEGVSAPRGEACGGVVGQLALFEHAFDELLVAERVVFLRAQSTWWSVETDTAMVRAYPAGEPPELIPLELSVNADPPELTLFTEVLWTDSLAGLRIDDELYAASEYGELWFADLSADAPEPRVIEQQAEFDGDDYGGHMGVDADAVYWQAGVSYVPRTSDGDPLALYRSCRIPAEGQP